MVCLLISRRHNRNLKNFVYLIECHVKKAKPYNVGDCNEEKLSSFVVAVDAQRELYKRVVIDIFNRKNGHGVFVQLKKCRWFLGVFISFWSSWVFAWGTGQPSWDNARRGCARVVSRVWFRVPAHHSALIASFTGERALFPQLPIGHAFQTPVAWTLQTIVGWLRRAELAWCGKLALPPLVCHGCRDDH